MLENIRGHSRGSIPPLRMPSLLPHNLCREWNVSRRLPAKRFFSSSSLSAIRVVSSAYLRPIIDELDIWAQKFSLLFS